MIEIERTQRGRSLIEHQQLLPAFSGLHNSVSPYLLSQGTKQKVTFTCLFCNSNYAHRVDNLTGPSRSKKSLKCLMNADHSLLQPMQEKVQGNSAGSSTWNTKFADLLIPYLDRISAKYPIFSTYYIGIDSILHDSWGFPKNGGKWDVFIYFPIINQLIVIDIDSYLYHAPNNKRKTDARKSHKWEGKSNVISIRMREDELESAFSDDMSLPSNGYEIENAFWKIGSIYNFDNGLNTLMQLLQFIAIKYLMVLSIGIDEIEFRKLYKIITRIHGQMLANQIKHFRIAKLDYLDAKTSNRKFIKTRHASFYKAYYDNTGCDTWNANRSLSYKQKALGGFVRSEFID